jgi:hypothetical protein
MSSNIQNAARGCVLAHGLIWFDFS